jgi:hypothetical protein
VRARSLAVRSALTVVVAVASQMPVWGQQSWNPPRTPDGQPDLQGVWLSNGATPLERPKALEGKSFLTDEEVRQLKTRADRLFKDEDGDAAPGDNFFLAALSNPEHYRNPNATGGAADMIEREFDNRTSLIVDPPDGRIPWTPEGQRRQGLAVAARLAAAPEGPEDLSNEMRCLTFGTPRIGGPYSAGTFSYYQILQTPGYVILNMEFAHEARVIPLDGRPHLPERVRQWSGDSRGRWEGNTLVVDSTNFSPKSFFLGSSERLHMVERFTRVAPNAIEYRVTVSDATTWTKPWTAEIRLKQTQERVYEVACHEGNFRIVTDILAGAHAQGKIDGKP